MGCEIRKRLKSVNLCNDFIEIGKVPDPLRTYEIKFVNLATDAIYIQNASSDNNGVLTIPGNFLAQGTGYELTVKDKIAGELVNVNVGYHIGMRFLLDFVSKYDIANAYYVKGTTEKLEVA